MRREGQSSITVEEAVGEMVNMDYIPANFTLLEMLAAFQEEADIECENARRERRPEEQMVALEIRMHACKGRYELAQSLLDSLHYEVDHQEGSMIVLTDESFSKQRLTFESVSDSMQLKQTGVSNKYTHRLTASNNYPAYLTVKPNGAQITQLKH